VLNADGALVGTEQRVQHLLAGSPAMIYTTNASGDFGRTFVSENLMSGVSAYETDFAG
jgi:hypothetical protein